MPEEMVIFTRVYDFVSWLMPLTLHFPRQHRFMVTQRLQNAALNVQELLIEANAQRGALRAGTLRSADAELVKVRLYLRLCERWQWLSKGQYQHASVQVAEVGRLLGGWLKTVASGPSAARGEGPDR